MKKIQMRLFIFSFLLFFLFAPVAYGDLYWESTIETSGAPEGMLKNMPKQLPDSQIDVKLRYWQDKSDV